MSFDSIEYLIFLPVVWLLFRVVPARFRWTVLLAASYVFYAFWDLSLSLLILAVTACSYGSGLLLNAVQGQRKRKRLLAATIFLLLGQLFFFKYFNMLGRTAAAIGSLFGGSGVWQPWDIVLPVGVSFYTFQAISYVIDVYRGTIRAERHFGYYALYISFFPQLVAGPIERSGALLPQLRASRTPELSDLGPVPVCCSAATSGSWSSRT